MLSKFCMAVYAVFTNANYLTIIALKVNNIISKATRFGNTPGCLILGIKIKQDVALANKIIKTKSIPFLIRQGKFRCLVSYIN